MRVMLFLLLSVIAISGCAAHNAEAEFQRKRAQYHAEEKRKESIPLQRQATFDPSEHIPYKAQGTASLSGEAFLRTRGGDVRYAAGREVLLVPATSYGKEYIEKDLLAAHREKTPPLDWQMHETIRSTQADSTGRFSFAGLPSGDYIVFTTIFWEVPQYSRYGSYSSSSGGPVWQPVTVRDGEQKVLILTR